MWRGLSDRQFRWVVVGTQGSVRCCSLSLNANAIVCSGRISKELCLG